MRDRVIDSRGLSAAEAAALEEGGFDLTSESSFLDSAEDPLARTAAVLAALAGTSLSTSQAAERLGVHRSRIRQRLTVQPPTLYGIRRVNDWVIPEFQFDGNQLLPGIGEVAAQLDPDLNPVSVLRWFTTPHPDLGAEDADDAPVLSPRDWLRLGLPPRAVADLAAEL